MYIPFAFLLLLPSTAWNLDNAGSPTAALDYEELKNKVMC